MSTEASASAAHGTTPMATDSMTGGDRNRLKSSFYAYTRSEPTTVRTTLHCNDTNLSIKYMKLLLYKGRAVAYWLRHYATDRKVAGPRPDEVNDFFCFSIYLILRPALGPQVY
jgi:hypothetical protein